MKNIPPYSKDAIHMIKMLGSKYQHYKGGYYKTLKVSRDSEDPTRELITYEDLEHRDLVWTRPLNMFMETVEVNGKYVPRFRKI